MSHPEPAWIRIQRKTFSRWVNQYISKREMEVKNLDTDLADGVILHALLEELGQTQIVPAPKPATIKIKKVENVNRLIEHIKKQGIKLVSIGAEDIHDGKTSLILGLIWTLILKYQIVTPDDDDGEARSLKNALLAWCNSVLNPQGVVVANFNKSWQDGRAFCGLVNALEPGTFNLEERTPEQALENLSSSFDIAFEKFQIPKMLDPEDVVSDPDELSIMTYVSYYRGFLQKNTAFGPNCFAEGPGLTTAQTKKRAEFTIIGVNEEGERANRGGATIRTQLLEADGSALCKVFVKDNLNGTYSCHYEAPKAGTFVLEVKVGKEHIKGSSFRPLVEPGEPKYDKCWAEGPGIVSAVAGEPARFTVRTADAGGTPLSKGGATILAVLKDPRGDCPVSVVDNGDGTYACEYTPKSAKPTTLSVKVSTETNGSGEIKGAPFKVNVTPGAVDAEHTIAKGDGTKGAKSGVKAPLLVVTMDSNDNPLTHGGEQISAELLPLSKGNIIPVDVVDNGDGTYGLEYLPTSAGPYQLNINLNGQPIKDSPIVLTVAPGLPDPLSFEWDELKVDADGRRIVVAGVTEEFKIHSKDSNGNLCNAGELDVEGTLTGTVDVPVIVSDEGDGSYSVRYTPKKAGPYSLDLTVDGKRIGGKGDEPVKILCVPASPSGKHSIAFGPGTEVATIGEDNTFTVQSKDMFGNNLTIGGANVGGRILPELGGPSVNVNVVDVGDGTYTCSYPGLAQIGLFNLTPTVNGEAVRGAPFRVRVWAGETDGENTFVLVPTEVQAGLESIDVELRDNFGNKQEKVNQKDKVVALCKPLTERVVPARDNGDGTYEIDFPADVNGEYELHVLVNGQPAPGGPWTNTIMPNPLPVQLKEDLKRLVPDCHELLERLLGSVSRLERERFFQDLELLASGQVPVGPITLPKLEKKVKKEKAVEVPLGPTKPIEEVEEVEVALPQEFARPKRQARPATTNPIKAAAAKEQEAEQTRAMAPPPVTQPKKPVGGIGFGPKNAAVNAELSGALAKRKEVKPTTGESEEKKGERKTEEREFHQTYKAPAAGTAPKMGFGSFDAAALRGGLRKTGGTAGDTHK
eukprot:TRINITY_DN1585_c0_g1_i4.p1 TRINITY_DN1585_c0_g1~~TRINITY_DN1585_c0_g1_i4.p1  ORF type:complete len:1109 (-),score=323.00 TRINITY_DN1585_c0_g1_i4:135-3389(-)